MMEGTDCVRNRREGYVTMLQPADMTPLPMAFLSVLAHHVHTATRKAGAAPKTRQGNEGLADDYDDAANFDLVEAHHHAD